MTANRQQQQAPGEQGNYGSLDPYTYSDSEAEPVQVHPPSAPGTATSEPRREDEEQLQQRGGGSENRRTWLPSFVKFGGSGWVPSHNEFEDGFAVRDRSRFATHLPLCLLVVAALAVLVYVAHLPDLVLHHDDKGAGDGVGGDRGGPGGAAGGGGGGGGLAGADGGAPAFEMVDRASFGGVDVWSILDREVFSDALLLKDGGRGGGGSRLAKPFPSGAFWTNAALLYLPPPPSGRDRRALSSSAVSDPIVAVPYAFKWGPVDGLQVSYPAYRRSVQPKVIKDFFYPDITLSCTEGVASRKITAYDSLSVTMRLYAKTSNPRNTQHSWFEAYVVQGSPYVTAAFQNAAPKLTALSTFASFGCMSPSAEEKGLCTKTEVGSGQKIGGVQFLLEQAEGQRWILFASEPLTLVVDGYRRVIHSKGVYSGVLRLALIPPDADLTGTLVKQILNHSGIYPTGGKVITEYHGSSSGEQDVASVNFVFDTVDARSTADLDLLMLALPHHAQVLDRKASKLLSKASFDGTYSCIKGNLTAVVGNSWSYREDLTSLDFLTDREIQSENMVDVIKAKLARDVSLVLPTAKDVYGFGKQIARMAQLTHISSVLHDEVAFKQALGTLQKYLERFFDRRTGQDRLVYDADLGGIVSSNGLADSNAEFGNGWYSDHHFHYGYLCFAAAILGKFNATFVEVYGDRVNALVADVANDDPTSSYFPVARHKSWYAGHSWASGLFPQGNGKSQESSSEAVNCYYGVYLWSLVNANARLKNFARLLLATEIRSAKTYWHMGPSSTTYDPSFAQNFMVGNLGGLDVTAKTWFGNKEVYVHLINLLPVTPITEELFNRTFVQSQYKKIGPMYNSTEMAWKGYLVCDHAIIDPASAWPQAQDLVSYQLDSGLSVSQVLYWIGTRPPDLPQYNVTKHVDTTCAGNEGCGKLGLKGNCCPTDGGVYLGCCG